jgi:protein-L-isoaspartate(D-aspartate) O-methyltransferase
MSPMLATIEAHFRDTGLFTGLGALAEPVREALLAVDRRHFVPAVNAALAQADSALPIGWGQTISQPFVVALMTQLLDIRPEHRVLEIGTGSGYQTAVLSRLAASVYSLEIIAELATQARSRLQRLGYDNIEVRNGDGYHGLAGEAPFDRILIAAAVVEIPPPLLAQLCPGGRLVAPVGAARGLQQLVAVDKKNGGLITRHTVLPVDFVPFTRAH